LVRLRIHRREDGGKDDNATQENNPQQLSNSPDHNQGTHDSKQTQIEPVQNSELKQHQPNISEGSETRHQLYRRDDVRRFAAWMLAGHDEIQPTRDPETGEYDYSKTGFNHTDFDLLLNELNSHEILQKYLIDTTPTCSKCEHSSFHLVYLCPFSQHSTLERGIMIEHFRCGHTDFETNFRSGSELICPKCRLRLKVIGTDYRKIENSFQCIGCGRKFSIPKSQYQCANCGWSNYENDLVMQPIYGYKLNDRYRSELLAHCSLESKITEVLKQFGFQVAAPALVDGLSGTQYSFDIVGTKDKTQVMFDLMSTTGEIAPGDIAAFYAKVFDAKPPHVYLVATPRVSKETERLCGMYGIEVIAAEEPNMICKGLEDKLSLLTGTSPLIADEHTRASTKDTSPPEVLKISKNEMPEGSDRQAGEAQAESSDGEKLLNDSKEPDAMIRKARVELSRLIDEVEQRLSK